MLKLLLFPDSYNTDLNDSDNTVSITQSNGPSGLHRGDQTEVDAEQETDISEPPIKKMRFDQGEEFMEVDTEQVCTSIYKFDIQTFHIIRISPIIKKLNFLVPQSRILQ